MSDRFDFEKFKTGSGLGPVYSWVWNSEISREVIAEQLTKMADAGIKTFYVLPEPKEFRPGAMNTYMAPDYLSDCFFDMIRFAKSVSKKSGMTMWLYDEGGWPSGRACGSILKKNPEYAARKISEKTVHLKKGECFCEEAIAVFDENKKFVELPYTASGDEVITVYFVEVADAQLIDILNVDAMNAFISGTYEKYKENLGDDFGGEDCAFFTDEAILRWPYYTDNIADFEKRSGFDFKRNIPALFDESDDEPARLFRAEYIDFCSREAEKSYLKAIHDVCRKGGIRFTGHMDGDHKISDYKMQVGNALRHLRNMDIPGVDAILRQIYPGKENVFFPRIASSAANQTGNKYSLSESFAVYGDGLTYDEMRYVCNSQFIRGINIINVMSIPSGNDRFLSAQMRPYFRPEKLNWQGLKEFNSFVSRMMYLCSVGDICVNSALYMPMRDMWAGNDVEFSYTELGKELEQKGVYFDIADDDFLENCTVIENRLVMGNAKYDTIYIPETKYMTDESRKTLEHFAKNGGRVLYSAEPEYQCGVKDSKIRIMKRVCDNAELYFMFNESCENRTVCPKFDTNYGCYLLSGESGGISEYKSGEKVVLSCGECAIFVLTDEKYVSEKVLRKGTHLMTLAGFEKETLKTSVFENGGFAMYDGETQSDGGRVVKYKAEFVCKPGTNLVIKLNGTPYAAFVGINGEAVSNMIFSPYEFGVSGEIICEHNTVVLTVSENPAKTLLRTDFSEYKSEMTGWYHAMTLDFEKEKIADEDITVEIYECE